MLGSIHSMILRLRTSALVVSLGALGLAACASPENASFDQTTPEEDGGLADANKPDSKADAEPADDGGEGGQGGQGGEGGSGGNGGDPADTCGLSTCPEPQYQDFFKCCTSQDKCGFKNGPNGFCYDATDDNPDPGTGGGTP